MFALRLRNLLKPMSNVLAEFKKFNHPPVCPTIEPLSKNQFGSPENAKVIIVGGTGCIGMATANQLLCSKACKVALIDLDATKGKDAVLSLNCAFGKDKAIYIKGNVTNKVEIQEALSRAKDELKEVHLIVNAFGIWDEISWEEEIKVNLIGALNVNDVANEHLTKPHGCVVNIIGIPGIEIFSPSPNLAASYLGVLGYSQAKGHERNATITGVRTVVLCCGLTHSNLLKDVDKKLCCPQMANDLKKYLKDACWQRPDVVAQAVIELLKFAPSGSAYVVESSRLFYLNLPDLNSFRVLQHQFI